MSGYAWSSARIDFEGGTYPAQIARWLGVSETDVWNLATTEGWKRPSASARDVAGIGTRFVPDWRTLGSGAFLGFDARVVIVDEFWALHETPMSWRDLPPVAYLTPIAFAALSLLSQVIGR
jgi:hypothetical protein